MGSSKPYRLHAMRAIGLAERVKDSALSMHYLNIAASYIALARLHEQIDHDRPPASEEVPRSRATES